MAHNILVINPGSTTTKWALFKNDQLHIKETIKHDESQLVGVPIIDQLDDRLEHLMEALKRQQVLDEPLSAVVGRGGFLRPLKSGTYTVDEEMIIDLEQAVYGEHASNLGALLAYIFGQLFDCPAYIVDPIVVDELTDLARYSGTPLLTRKSHAHALNIKAVVRKAAAHIRKPYDQTRMVVVHLGSGISVAAHANGQMIDVNNADNEGPFSPERTGTLPAKQLVKLCYSGRFSEQEMLNEVTKQGGLYAYLGTKDVQHIEQKIAEGDAKSKQVLEAMVYQIGKEIGAMATVLEGELDGIVLTGGLAYSPFVTEAIKTRVSFLGDVLIIPGEEELEALASGALRVLNGEEAARQYGTAFQHVVGSTK